MSLFAELTMRVNFNGIALSRCAKRRTLTSIQLGTVRVKPYINLTLTTMTFR
jgi:hypothetical protein